MLRMINKRLLFKVLLVFIFASILFFSPKLTSIVKADCGDPCPGNDPSTTRSCSTQVRYRCETNTCDDLTIPGDTNDIERRERSRHEHRTKTCTAAGVWVCGAWQGCHPYGSFRYYVEEDCDDWEVCVGNTSWTSALGQYCECSTDCLEVPTGEYLEDGTGVVPPTDVDLPVRFGWGAVPGAQSYIYRAWKIDPPTTTIWDDADATTTGVTINNLTVFESGNPGPCFLELPATTSYYQSTSTNWQVSPCCDLLGADCKDWTDVNLWLLEASIGPQLVTSTDPDWNDTTQWALNVPFPVTLGWCGIKINNLNSYNLRFYTANGGIETGCHPWLLDDAGQCRPIKVEKGTTHPYDEVVPQFKDSEVFSFFAEDSEYLWEVATCVKKHGYGAEEICGDYGQKWGFETENLPPPGLVRLQSPPNDPPGRNPVGLPVVLSWQRMTGVNSFRYQVIPGIPPTLVPPPKSSVALDWNDLSLNSRYMWRVRPCTDYAGTQCGPWSPPWWFVTTGASPANLRIPADGDTDVLIPVEFNWTDVSGAGSYVIEVRDNVAGTIIDRVALVSMIFIDYPDLDLNTNYSWRVRTCADIAGTAACGSWSHTWVNAPSFTTFSLTAPVNPTPVHNARIEEAIDITLSWDEVLGAKAYHYRLRQRGEIGYLFDNIVFSNSASHNPSVFPEIAWYDWEVRACLDNACTVTGNWSSLWSFDLRLEAPPEMRGGLVPCGRDYDDPDTPPPMNERDQCQIHHAFLLLRNVLDFALWKVATALFIIIILAIAGLFYISHGDQSLTFRLKSLFKSVLIGYLAVFFAWLFINVFLSIIGYNFQIFGRWWEISL